MPLFNIKGFVCFIFSLIPDTRHPQTAVMGVWNNARVCALIQKGCSTSPLLSSIKVKRYRNSSEFEKQAVGEKRGTLLLSHYRKS